MRVLRRGKKGRERLYIEIMLEQLEGGDKATVADHEEPDFLVTLSGRTVVGVEVTELVRTGPQRRSVDWEGACSGIVRAAKQEWEARGQPNVDVFVVFDPATTFPKADRIELGREIALVAQSILPPKGQQHIAGQGPAGYVVPQAACPPGVVTISVSRPAGAQRNWWNAQNSGAVPDLEPNLVQNAIDKKSELLPNYRASGAEEFWLLLGYGFSRVSSFFTIPGRTLSHKYQSPFDHTILVGVFHEKVDELYVA